MGQGVPIYKANMVMELLGPFPKRTLTQFKRHVGPAATDDIEDLKADATDGGGTVLDEDYLVDQTPHQYHRDPFPPHPFYLDLDASSSSAPPLAIHERQDHSTASLSTMATDLHSLIPDDKDDDDDDNDGDNGDFTLDTSTV
ncbi:hypothetical protein F0562_019585 [Nyssa sinensis]|uniref:Uncharacterized protein n=1 Tax=Nyssa sinensis TaxID=561372 RepID=A0A5J5BQ97_9ASTE|nr:hypothetical protein F0562_019585 [Nyssa sinensis]